MRLNAPTQVVFFISLIIVVLALIGKLVTGTPFLSPYDFWIAIVGYIVLAAGCIMKGV